MLLTVKSAVAEDEQAIVALWRACDLVASYNDPGADFRFAKAGPCSDVLVAVDDAGEVAGSVMVGHDGIEAGSTTLLPILDRAARAWAGAWCRRQRIGSANGG